MEMYEPILGHSTTARFLEGRASESPVVAELAEHRFIARKRGRLYGLTLPAAVMKVLRHSLLTKGLAHFELT